MRALYFNLPDQNHRAYTPGILDNIQAKLDAYIVQGQAKADKLKEDAMSSIPSASNSGSSDDLTNMPGVKESLESRNTQDAVGQAFDGGFNATVSMDGINQSTAGVEAGIDKGLNGLCQGFKLGKAGCQPPVPINLIPFNQAFLFPGKYHVFGCQKLNLSPLDKGIPLLYAPATLQTTVGPMPTIGPYIGPQKGPGDGFAIWAPG
jgi:hypothetical protein